MKRILLAAVIGFLTLGCHTPTQKEKDMALAKQVDLENARRRYHYVEANPELAPAVKRAIAHGELVIGMTESDVRASIGEPDQIETTATDHGSREHWYYKNGPPAKELLFFDDGALTGRQPTQ